MASALNDLCALWLTLSAQWPSQQSRLQPAEGALFPVGSSPEVSLLSGGLVLTERIQNIPWELRLGVRKLLRPRSASVCKDHRGPGAPILPTRHTLCHLEV